MLLAVEVVRTLPGGPPALLPPRAAPARWAPGQPLPPIAGGADDHESPTPVSDAIETATEVQNRGAAIVADAEQRLSEQIAALADELREFRAGVAEGAGVEGVEARLAALEERVLHPHAELDPASEAEAVEVQNDPLELPRQVIEPRKRHWFHNLPRWV